MAARAASLVYLESSGAVVVIVRRVTFSDKRRKRTAPRVPRAPRRMDETARPSARGAISADSAPTARARNATRDALPTPEAAPSAPSASPAKLPILRARRAIIRLGLRRRIALSASISTTERTSRSGAAKHVPREYPVEGRSRGAESNKLPSCSDGRAARPATFLP